MLWVEVGSVVGPAIRVGVVVQADVEDGRDDACRCLDRDGDPLGRCRHDRDPVFRRPVADAREIVVRQAEPRADLLGRQEVAVVR